MARTQTETLQAIRAFEWKDNPRASIRVVKVKGRCNWAVMLTVLGKEPRFRGFHYKSAADSDCLEWLGYDINHVINREFPHNFTSAETLGIAEVKE